MERTTFYERCLFSNAALSFPKKHSRQPITPTTPRNMDTIQTHADIPEA